MCKVLGISRSIVHKARCNEDKIENKINREFDREEKLNAVVSDLTYVNVKGKWNYICLISIINELKF